MQTKPTGGLVVVTVNYRSVHLVLAALPALLAELAPLERAQVLIVDNASPDGDADTLAEGLAGHVGAEIVRLIRSPANGGFAAGNNIAFREIDALDWTPEAVLLLNPDAEVRPGAIAEMLRVLRATPKAGFVGPRVENTDGTTWVGAFNFPSMGGEVFPTLGIDAFARHFRSTVPDCTEPTRVDWITGTAMLIRYEALLAIGPMDEGYFLYYEEVDYMLSGARLGWQSWHAPDALVHHIAGASTGVVERKVRQGRMPAYWFQSWARFFAKNHGPGYARLTAFFFLIAMVLGDFQRWVRGRYQPRPERFMRDFMAATLFGRLTPPPSALERDNGRPA